MTTIYRTILFVSLIVADSSACEMWPNSTDRFVSWWPCRDNGDIATFEHVEAVGGEYGEYVYPMNFTKPFFLSTAFDLAHGLGKIRLDVRIWQWVKCDYWFEIETGPHLANVDACNNTVVSGLTCPITAGFHHYLLKFDFTSFGLESRPNDWPYLLQFRLSDRQSTDQLCFWARTRAFTQ